MAVHQEGAVHDDDGQKRSLRAGMARLSTVQERFEESRVGKIVISGLVAVLVIVAVVWNLPDSPITRSLQQVVKPVAASSGLDQYWGMYGTPDSRVETVEVNVVMANGETRVWTMRPGSPGVGWWDRWILLRRAVIHDSSVRPQLAEWVVRQVTRPDERPVGVTVLLRTENLQPPGAQTGGKAPASKVLYQQALAGPQ